MNRLKFTVFTAVLTLLSTAALSQGPSAESRKLAAEIPIFDMHMHVYPGLTPSELEARMNRNGVQWGGGVGAVNPQADISVFKEHLKDRYFPTIGQPEMAASYIRGGVGAMSTLDNPMIKRVLSTATALFSKREAYGFGELILNNQNSNPNPQFRRQAQIDSPVVRQMFTLAAEHGVIVQMHIEPHSKSLQELKTLLKEFPKVSVVISHCLAVNSSPREMNALFEEFPQIYCELSARTQTVLARRPEAQIFGYEFAKSDWVVSIEKYSDRYMVGTDVTGDYMNYDEEIKQIRTGLLQRLTPATLQKVAHLNAKRLMQIKD
jgi:hypothetical protein